MKLSCSQNAARLVGLIIASIKGLDGVAGAGLGGRRKDWTGCLGQGRQRGDDTGLRSVAGPQENGGHWLDGVRLGKDTGWGVRGGDAGQGKDIGWGCQGWGRRRREDTESGVRVRPQENGGHWMGLVFRISPDPSGLSYKHVWMKRNLPVEFNWRHPSHRSRYELILAYDYCLIMACKTIAWDPGFGRTIRPATTRLNMRNEIVYF
jgi:hypothetical protein